MRIVMLSPISPLGKRKAYLNITNSLNTQYLSYTGDFYIYSIDLNGRNSILQMKNVRTNPNQNIPDPFNTMHVVMGWCAMRKSYTPCAVIDFHGCGRVQLIYIRSIAHLHLNDIHDVFYYEFRNQTASFSTPKIKNITDGLGYEIVVHLCRDGEEFLRILDCSGYLDTEFNWIGDIPLSRKVDCVQPIPEEEYRAYRTTLALGYREIPPSDASHDRRYKGSYLISRFNPHRDQREHLQLAKVYYTEPKENPQRTLPINFQVKLQEFSYARYVTQNETVNEWRCLRVMPLDASNSGSLLPKCLAVLKIQYTADGGIKYKVSLKSLPRHLEHFDFDDPFPHLLD